MDPQTAAAVQQLSQDPAAVQQLQAELGKLQAEGMMKQVVSEIQKQCFKRCVDTVPSQQLTRSEEQCMLQCANNRFKIAEKVGEVIQGMMQQQEQSQGFYKS